MATVKCQQSLEHVWGSSGSDVFAVGSWGKIIRYDGNTWTQINSGTENSLTAIWGNNSNELFIVGGGGAILHYTNILVSPTTLQIPEPSSTATFTITLASAPTADVTIDLYSSNPTECTVSPRTVTLNATNWNTGVTATVTAEPDYIADGTQYARILTFPAVSDDPEYNGANGSNVSVAILDDYTGPSVFSVNPSYAVTGQTLPLTIEGQNFDSTTRVFAVPETGSTIELTPVNLISSTTLTASLPAPSTATTYTIRVTSGAFSDELPDAVEFTGTTDVSLQRRKKAILVAAGNPDPYSEEWGAIHNLTDTAYRTLLAQGYTHDTIYYLSTTLDSDVDGDGTNDVEADATINDLETALTTWADDPGDPTDELILFLVGPGENGRFLMGRHMTQALQASTLDNWLDDLQASIPGRVIVIYDAPLSGSFLSALTPPSGKERIVITGTGSRERAYYLDEGELSFSYRFWQTLFNYPDLLQSFTFARDYMLPLQTAMIETYDGVTLNSFARQGTSENVTIGRGRFADTNPPEIGTLSADPAALSGGNTTSALSASGVEADNGLSRVWGRIIQPINRITPPTEPGIVLPTFKMLDIDGDGLYDYTHEEFTQHGDYHVFVHAVDKQDHQSLPQMTQVEQTEGEILVSKGDVDIDGELSMRDLIMVLKYLCGMDVYPAEAADIQGLDTIDTEEAIYILQAVSGMRE